MIPRILGMAKATDLPSDADARIVEGTHQISRPRTYFGTSKDQSILTKGAPPNGVYFFNIEQGNLQQWVVDHWETIGQTFLGDISDDPLKKQQAPEQTPTPYGYSGGGGSGVAIGSDGSTPILTPSRGGRPSVQVDNPVPNPAQDHNNTAAFNDGVPVTVGSFAFSLSDLATIGDPLVCPLSIVMNIAVPGGVTFHIRVFVNGNLESDIPTVGPGTVTGDFFGGLTFNFFQDGANLIEVEMESIGGTSTATQIFAGVRVLSILNYQQLGVIYS